MCQADKSEVENEGCQNIYEWLKEKETGNGSERDELGEGGGRGRGGEGRGEEGRGSGGGDMLKPLKSG